MNDVVAQRFGIADAQRSCARRLNLAATIRQSPPKHVVLSPTVDADHSPHLMIVGHDRHHGSPDYIKDRKIRRVVELLNLGALRLAHTFENRIRVRYGARDHLAYQLVR